MANSSDFVQETWIEIAVLWSIKGYHAFKVRPCSDISLIITPEEGNKYDPHAMLVKMPDTVPDQLLEKVTRAGDAKRRPQLVKDIIGKTVGRVPANLSKVFRSLVEKRLLVSDISCFFGGRAGHTVDVPHWQSFKKARTRAGHYRQGGGAELSCRYTLKVKMVHIDEAKAIFKEKLTVEELSKVMFQGQTI